jgi:hypothetical protein
MIIEEYTQSILQLIRSAVQLEDDGTTAFSQLHNIFRHALYGYEEFGKKYASKKAQEKYENLGLPGQITQWQGRQQNQFDPKGKQHRVFHLEHVYTLSMFERALKKLSQEQLTVSSINKIVQDNFAVAWILREENEILNKRGYKIKRGITLSNALNIYREVGVILIDGAT